MGNGDRKLARLDDPVDGLQSAWVSGSVSRSFPRPPTNLPISHSLPYMSPEFKAAFNRLLLKQVLSFILPIEGVGTPVAFPKERSVALGNVRTHLGVCISQDVSDPKFLHPLPPH